MRAFPAVVCVVVIRPQQAVGVVIRPQQSGRRFAGGVGQLLGVNQVALGDGGRSGMRRPACPAAESRAR